MNYKSVICSRLLYRLNEVSVKGMLWGFSFFYLLDRSIIVSPPSVVLLKGRCCNYLCNYLGVATIYEPPKKKQQLNTCDLCSVERFQSVIVFL